MPKRTWEKVLYKKQNVPDNYVDETFLADLQRNVNLYNYTWYEVLTGVCILTHEIASTVLFVVTFVYLHEDIFSIASVLTGMSVLVIVAAVIQQWTLKDSFHPPWRPLNLHSAKNHAKSLIIFLIFSYMFSPILKTLTASISTDTIYTTATLTLIVHIAFQDYGANIGIASPSLALNSSIFAAVCLASRLDTSQHTFALVVLAVESFVVLPLIRKRLDVVGLVVVSFVFFVVVFVALLWVDVVYAGLFVVLCVCVNFVFPASFMYCQKYKENICGPWDEATVKTS